MRQSIFLFCFCLLTTLPQAFSQTQSKTGSISDISFIEGSWKAVAGDRSIDAVWSALGENMVGHVRVTRENKVVLYEMFAFEKSEQGLVALVRHFAPGLIAREEKENPNYYKFLEAGNAWALFEKQGEPVRVRYEKRSEGNGFAIVVGRKQEGGSEWVFKDFWVFERR